MESTISGSRITNVLPIHDSLIYVTSTFGYTAMNPITGEVKNYNNFVDSVPHWTCSSTWDVAMDTLRNTIWIATSCGLVKQDLQTGRISFLKPENPVDGKWMPGEFNSVEFDPTHPDRLWLGSLKGFFVYYIDIGQYKHVTYPDQPDKSLIVNNLYLDTTGILWMSTADERIIGWEWEIDQWRQYYIPVPPSNTVSGRNVYDVLPIGRQSLWVSTTLEVGILDQETGEFEAWRYSPDYPDGLLVNNIYRDMLFDRNGRLWVGSWQGVQYARQAYVPRSQRVKSPQVMITSVKCVPVMEERNEPLLYQGKLELNKDQRDITFQYVLPNPLDTRTVTYRYKLEGYDDEWITGSQRTVRYPRLHGGLYTFIITAKEQADDPWLPETRMEIYIPKRITEFIWFWLLSGILFAALVYAISRYRIARIRRAAELRAGYELQLSEIQMQALRAQMNPHFLFNSLNSIKYYAISKSKDETATYLSKFAMLVRVILNNSKERTISLKDELEALQLYIEIEHLRLEGKFSYLFDIDNGLHIQQAQIPPMILQPIVENAIWHGLMHKEGMGRLLVQVKDMGRQIQCIIEDNGVGRARSAELRDSQMSHKKSVGMQITGDRIELINRIYGIDTRVQVIDLTDDEGRAAGTRVVIHIPLIHEEE